MGKQRERQGEAEKIKGIWKRTTDENRRRKEKQMGCPSDVPKRSLKHGVVTACKRLTAAGMLSSEAGGSDFLFVDTA